MTVTTERPTDLPADSLASTAGTTVLEEPSSRTALRKRPRGRHRAAAVVRADSVPGEMSHGEILRAMTGLLAALFTAMLSSTIVATALPRSSATSRAPRASTPGSSPPRSSPRP